MSDHLSLKNIIGLDESEFLDYKREYPSVNSDLLHDILCLANSVVDSDRYLVFGVDDNKNICGVETDPKRKNLADIINMLRSSRLNKIPRVSLKLVKFGSQEIDILVIKDTGEKPYFLSEDYTSNGRPLRAGAVYTRTNGTSPDHIVEKMYYERFGLKLSPKERLIKYLQETSLWRYG